MMMLALTGLGPDGSPWTKNAVAAASGLGVDELWRGAIRTIAGLHLSLGCGCCPTGSSTRPCVVSPPVARWADTDEPHAALHAVAILCTTPSCAPHDALGDRWGRRPVLLAGLIVFGEARAAAGVATSSEVVIAARHRA
ncbi:hypothetical protein ALI22I_05435 [Saccharothrix sp. ALI-22-I]|nr:hypothetical protein ALI22I_05435 [Saccharothrix sp. ALI-22-I]